MIRTYLGIELGAKQINVALIDERHALVALGTYAWESTLENGVWTYPLEELWKGLRSAVGQVLGAVKESVSVEGIGVSGMMHGYMPFDGEGNLLSPYRSARNDFPARASRELTALFGRNIPRRWSIAHLYHAVYSQEPHVRDIHRVCTLACYVHARLTGEFVAGIGEAIGMFPLDGDRYDPRCVAQFAEITSEYGLPWALPDVLPGIRKAGEYAGVLTDDGARLLDSTGRLKAGILFAPPEGDAGTEMVATNSIAPRTGHVSANRNIVSMTVLEKPLSPRVSGDRRPCDAYGLACGAGAVQQLHRRSGRVGENVSGILWRCGCEPDAGRATDQAVRREHEGRSRLRRRDGGRLSGGRACDGF